MFKYFMRIARKEKNSLDRWKQMIEAFIVAAGIILFWRGVWHLADVFVFPHDYTLSAWVSLIVGGLMLVLTKNFVKQFLHRNE